MHSSLEYLVFTGFNCRVAALDRRDGHIVWQWKAANGGSNYVTLLLEPDLLVVSVDGYMYGLEPLTGRQLWHNSLVGFGTGVASLASINGIGVSNQGASISQANAHRAATTT